MKKNNKAFTLIELFINVKIKTDKNVKVKS